VAGVSVVVVVTAFPVPEHRAEVIAAFEEAITRVHDEPGVELYALYEGRDRLVMIEKYQSEQARSAHLNGAALAALRSALDGKLSSNLDAQVLIPHPAGNAHKSAL
jgi:quinol monooxygenase YgiN